VSLAQLGALTLLLLPATVLIRSAILRSRGITAIKFGHIDKSDFLIPLVAWPFFYLVFANAFGWRTFVGGWMFGSLWATWGGVVLCALGLVLMVAGLVSFGTSFRVGIDEDAPDNLITTGVFAFTRNPIYVAFAFVLLGEFLIFPNWLVGLYVIAAFALFHRQVLREEAFLAEHYGPQYAAYTATVRRYL
jgi:protein-S-isoprenylcysteine O-methyltransferase Ste14